MLANEFASLLFLAAGDPEVASEVISWENDDLFESIPLDTRVGEGTADVLLPKNDKIPPDFLSTDTGFDSRFSSGSTVFHPAGMSSFGISTLLLTEISHAARLFAVKRCDMGLLRAIGRFFDSLRL